MPGAETRADLFLRIHRAAAMFIANVEELHEGFIPRFEAETAIAVAAHHIVDGLARLDSPPNAEGAALPIHIERALKALGASVGRQLDRWGWTYPRNPDGLTTLNARLDRHHTEKERPFLQAVRTWREATDVERHEAADSRADRARELGIPTDPSLTPKEAEKLTWERHQAWVRDSIALASEGEKPADADQGELDAMKRFVDDIGVFARNLEADQRRAEVLERARSHALDRLQAPISDAAEPENVAGALQPRPPSDGDRSPNGEIREDDDGFISFGEASELTGLKPYEITRACYGDSVRSLGKGKGRRVHAADLAKYVFERNKP